MSQSEAEVEQERTYLRFLKRRQRTSWLVERGVVVLLFSLMPVSRLLTQLAWWLALSYLLLVPVLLVTNALDAAVEQRYRTHWHKQQETHTH